MSVTALANKTVSFRSPYTGNTFQLLTEKILGADGYLSGGAASDNGSIITIAPVAFVQRGLIVEIESEITGLAVPTDPEPWFVIASSPDDDPTTLVTISVTRDLVLASTGVVIAYKTGGAWQNPLSVNAQGAKAIAAEPGVEAEVEESYGLSGSNFDKIRITPGLVVDPAGIRRNLPSLAGASAQAFNETPLRSHASSGRQDYIVLRQREPFSAEIKQLFGGQFNAGGYLQQEVDNGTAPSYSSRPAVYAKRNGLTGEIWFAFGGQGASLGVDTQGGFAGAGYAKTTTFATGGNVSSVWIVGQRASDDALICLFSTGTDLQMGSFNGTNGAQVDAPVTIGNMTGTVTRVRAALDGQDQVHVVFEHNEGGSPSQQIYYVKASALAANFGTAPGAPAIVAGANTGKNDVDPDIALDRMGNAHIVYATGTGSNRYGDFVYAVIDANKNLVSLDTYLVGSDVGAESIVDPQGVVSNVLTSIRRARVTVNDFDEVTAVAIGDGTDLLVFAPHFEERLGYALVSLGAVPDSEAVSVDVVTGERGEVQIAYLTHDGGSSPFFIYSMTLDVAFASNGHIHEHILRRDVEVYNAGGNLSTRVAGGEEEDILLVRGILGDFVSSLTDLTNYDGKIHSFATLEDDSNAVRQRSHPKDVYLASYEAPDGTVTEDRIRTFNVRPKKMNYPFLVGRDGDFQGFDAVYDAVREANRLGGEVVVRPGDYRNISTGVAPGALQLAAGVSLRGDGQVSFEGYEFRLGTSVSSWSINNINGDIVERTASFGGVVKEGDLVQMATSGFHRVLKVLPYKSPYAGRLLLSQSQLGGAPAGATITIFPSGGSIQNVSFVGDPISLPAISVFYSDQALIKGVAFLGDVTGLSGLIEASNARNLLIDQCNFANANQSGTAKAVLLSSCSRPIIRGCLGNGSGVNEFDIDQTNDNPMVVGCIGLVDGTGAVTRTSPLNIVGQDDENVAGITAATDSVTGVGKVVKTVDGTLHLQDDNTRAGATPNIPLSDSGVGGDVLPAGANSLLHAVYTNKANIDSNDVDIAANTAAIAAHETLVSNFNKGVIKSGVLFGCTPSEGTGTAVDYTAGEYIAGGKVWSFGPLTISTSTVASTTYYYWVDEVGVHHRDTSLPNTDDPNVCMLLIAKTNSVNTGFEQFIDFRFCIGKNYQKGPLIVGPEGADVDADETHFFSIYGAVEYLIRKDRNEVGEIIVTGECDLDAGKGRAVGAHLYIDFFSTNLGGIIIRGVGERAGIKTTDTTQPAIWCNGLNGATDRDEKVTVRIHNLLIKSNATSGPTVDDDPAIMLSNSFHDVVIDRCSVRAPDLSQVGGTTGWQRVVDVSSNFSCKDLTIANNYFEGGEYDGIDLASTTTGLIENAYIFRNVFAAAAASGASVQGAVVRIGETTVNAWVTENTVTDTDLGTANGWASFVNFTCRQYLVTQPTSTLSGIRMIADNVVNPNSSFINDIFICNRPASGDAAPYYILNNTVIHNVGDFLVINARSRGALIAGNHWEGGLYFVDCTPATSRTATEGYERIVNNYLDLSSAVGTGGKALFLRGDRIIFAGNRVIGGYRQIDIDDDIGDTTEGDVFLLDNIVTDGLAGGVGFFIYRCHRMIIRGNVVKSAAANWEAMTVYTCEDHVVTDNFFENDTGETVACTITNGIFANNKVRRTNATTGDAYCLHLIGSGVIVGNFIEDAGLDVMTITNASLKWGSSIAIGNYYVGALGGGSRNGVAIGGTKNVFIGNKIVQDATGSYANVRLESAVRDGTFIGNVLDNLNVAPTYWADIRSAKTFDEWGTSNLSSTPNLGGTNREV